MTSLKRPLSPVVAFCFIITFIAQSFPIYGSQTNLLNLPEPGRMISLSPKFVPAFVKGISIYPNDPFKFDFIIDTGNAKLNDQQFKEESNKLIKYFMAALTVPEKEDWVNLSPYEKDRIIPESLGVTEMGRDMLAQDYILKQLTSSLIYPEKEMGKEFWSKVYAAAQARFGTTQIPVSTFNKVWIVPSQAVVWEHGNSAYVVRSHLKVMLEQDYLSLNKHLNNNIFSGSGMDQQGAQSTNTVGSKVVREVVLPALEKEVNEGANFAAVRQIFNSAILAAWYKQNLKQSILGQVYANQNKVSGIDLADRQIKQKIYERYLQAFKKGVFNFIKEDEDPLTHQVLPRKYFSGGVVDLAVVTGIERGDFTQLPSADETAIVGGTNNKVTVDIVQADVNADKAMLTPGVIAERADWMKGHILFGGNWKARKDITTEEQARAKAREFIDKFQDIPFPLTMDAEIVIFPERQWVHAVAEEIKNRHPFVVGVQSLWFDPNGDLQKQIDDAVAAGATYANVAHSMHRLKGAGLTDAQANKILKAILKDGRLIPWYTIEESGEDVNGRSAQKEIDDAIDIGLEGISPDIIASFPTTIEPTVLISTKGGTGVVDTTLQASPEDARQRIEAVHNALAQRYDNTLASSNIGYGASVKSSNARGIFAVPSVKNALIGGASLEADEFFNTVLNGMYGADEAAKANASQAMVAVAAQYAANVTSTAAVILTKFKLRGADEVVQNIRSQKAINPDFDEINTLISFFSDISNRIKHSNLSIDGQPEPQLTDVISMLSSREALHEPLADQDFKKMTKAIKDVSDGIAKRIYVDVANKDSIIVRVRASEGFGRDEVAESLKANEVIVPDGIKQEIHASMIGDDMEIYTSKAGRSYPIVDVIVDVVEGTNSFVTNSKGKGLHDIKGSESGATSTIVMGPGVKSLGNVPDLYAGLFMTNLGKNAGAFRQEKINVGGTEYFLSDPELYAQHPASIMEYLRFLADIRGLSIEHLQEEMVVMDRGREKKFLAELSDIQHFIPGLVITTIADGTVAHGLKAAMPPEMYRKATGREYGLHKTVLTISAAPEGFMNLAIAGLLRDVGAVGTVRINSKNVNNLDETKQGKDKAVNQDRRYAFSNDEKEENRELRHSNGDAEEIIAGSKKFTEQDVQGEVLGLFSFITTNGVFHQPGVISNPDGDIVKVLKIGLADGLPKAEIVDQHFTPDSLEEITPQTNGNAAMLADAQFEAYETKDSRGKPTVEARLTINGNVVTADVPAGASKGEDEAKTLSTGQAVENIINIIAPALKASGLDISKHEDLVKADRMLIAMGAKDNFASIGANATVPVSRALWKMAAKMNGMELGQYIRKFEPDAVFENDRPTYFYMNIFNGGLHAIKPGETLGKDRIDFQEVMIAPVAQTYAEALSMGDKIDEALKELLLRDFAPELITRADEAGFSVKGLGSTDKAIEYVIAAIRRAGFEPGKEVKLALDTAASSFYGKKEAGTYDFQNQLRTSQEMNAYYDELAQKYKGILLSLEDGLDENDWDHWPQLTAQMEAAGVKTIGDDIFVTQESRFRRGITSNAASAILIKVNQNGTMTGTLDIMKLAKANGKEAVVSHRSGETMDDSIADLAWGTKSFGLKTGDPQPAYDFGPGKPYADRQLVRRAKYNRMVELERIDNQASVMRVHSYDNPVRVGINGGGRIGGVNLLRALVTRKNLPFVVGAVNDFGFKITDKKGAFDPVAAKKAGQNFVDILTRNFKSQGSQVGNTKISYSIEDNKLYLLVGKQDKRGGQKIRLLDGSDPEKLPWGELNIDVVIESTGKFTTKKDAAKHLKAGAKMAFISAPAKEGDDIQTIVAGVNQSTIDYRKLALLISLASCTTGSIAPVARALLDAGVKIKSGTMVTMHAVTGDQTTLDMIRPDAPERGIAAGFTNIQATTGAAKAIGEVIPELKGKMQGYAIRSPVPNGSATKMDFVVEGGGWTAEKINAILKAAAEGPLKGIMRFTDKPFNSTDILSFPESSIVHASGTIVAGAEGNHISILASYDNEFGYSNRLLDMIALTFSVQGVEEDDPDVLYLSPSIRADIENNLRAAANASVNAAMVVSAVEPTIVKAAGDKDALSAQPLGGINLDANLYNMQVLRDGNGMVLPISEQPIGQFMKIKGFRPVFLNIERNINLSASVTA